MTKIRLAGGMGNRGAVVRVGDTIRRPADDQTPFVLLLLEHLAAKDFPAPVPVGRDDRGRETFRWIEGDVPVAPYPEWSLTDRALASVGRLHRRYHDAVRSFSVTPPHLRWSDELADPRGGPIVCHNDVCPENVVFRDGDAVALLDFDLAAPGRSAPRRAQTARTDAARRARASRTRSRRGEPSPCPSRAPSAARKIGVSNRLSLPPSRPARERRSRARRIDPRARK
jgi:Ser/Thr protein kinase RdoA (MazF antagonist)